MSQPTPEFQNQFLTNLQRLLSECLFVASWNDDLLMAFADICIEHGKDDAARWKCLPGSGAGAAAEAAADGRTSD